MTLSVRFAPLASALTLSLSWPVSAAPNDGLMTMEQVLKEAHDSVEYIGNEALQRRIRANPKLILLDVRTREEYDAGHLKGATWIDRGLFEYTLARSVRDPGAEIVVYCKKGNRSGMAVKALKHLGYQNVKAHAGFDAWVKAGLPFHNFLGEAKMIQLRELNASSFPVNFSLDKD